MWRVLIIVLVVAVVSVTAGAWAFRGELKTAVSVALLLPYSDLLKFSERLVGDGFHYVYGIDVADFDGDGRLEITATDTFGPGHEIAGRSPSAGLYYFTNAGGRFEQHALAVQELEDGESLFPERHVIADLDGDGDLDVAAVVWNRGEIHWFENRNENWQWHVLREGLSHPVNIQAGDVDGDGDADLVVASSDGGYFWLKNADDWPLYRIDHPAAFEPLRESRTIALHDVDGDGDLDLIGSDPDRILLFRNEGRVWEAEVIDDTIRRPMFGHVTDGYFVIGHQSGISIYRIEDWARTDIPGSWPYPGWLNRVVALVKPYRHFVWFETQLADLDNDGRMDIVGTIMPRAVPVGGSVVVFENRPEGWRRNTLKQNWGMTNQVLVADIDSDGLLDILAVTEEPHNEVRVWLNMGRRIR